MIVGRVQKLPLANRRWTAAYFPLEYSELVELCICLPLFNMWSIKLWFLFLSLCNFHLLSKYNQPERRKSTSHRWGLCNGTGTVKGNLKFLFFLYSFFDFLLIIQRSLFSRPPLASKIRYKTSPFTYSLQGCFSNTSSHENGSEVSIPCVYALTFANLLALVSY